jgi:hypothetical protein
MDIVACLQFRCVALDVCYCCHALKREGVYQAVTQQWISTLQYYTFSKLVVPRKDLLLPILPRHHLYIDCVTYAQTHQIIYFTIICILTVLFSTHYETMLSLTSDTEIIDLDINLFILFYFTWNCNDYRIKVALIHLTLSGYHLTQLKCQWNT